MPELERWVLHRMTELDARIRAATESYDWTGVYPELHAFCAADLSAFYFDIRKDAIYCDRPDSLRRRSARTVLDHLHRCLTIWLAPVLCFTAEEAWSARFGERTACISRPIRSCQGAGAIPALAAKWAEIRAVRGRITAALEAGAARGQDWLLVAGNCRALPLSAEQQKLLTEEEWAEVAIVSCARMHPGLPEDTVSVSVAAGSKCARCWRVLPEVGQQPGHPALCARCADAVESGSGLPGGRMMRASLRRDPHRSHRSRPARRVSSCWRPTRPASGGC